MVHRCVMINSVVTLVVYAELFGSRLSQGMRSWLCDVLSQLI